MKDFRIFEDYGSKSSTKLLDYNKGTPTFQGFFFEDNNDKQFKDGMHWTWVSGRKVLETEKVNKSPSKEELYLTYLSG